MIYMYFLFIFHSRIFGIPLNSHYQQIGDYNFTIYDTIYDTINDSNKSLLRNSSQSFVFYQK